MKEAVCFGRHVDEVSQGELDAVGLVRIQVVLVGAGEKCVRRFSAVCHPCCGMEISVRVLQCAFIDGPIWSENFELKGCGAKGDFAKD